VRNNILDARGELAPKAPVEKQNEFGGLLGGPIVKDKYFFMVAYDGFRLRSGGAGTIQTVSTALERTGNFTELLGPQIGADPLGKPMFQGEIYDITYVL
jgi:hypothetical protein